MWHSEDDFFADIDQLDEIGTTITQNDFSRSEFQRRQTGNIVRISDGMAHRSRLYSEDEDEQDLDNPQHFNDENDLFSCLKEIENEIKLATGNVYNNDEILKHWQSVPAKKEENTEKTVEPQTDETLKETIEVPKETAESLKETVEAPSNESLIFQTKINFDNVLPLDNISNTITSTKLKKQKQSVASQLSESLQVLKTKKVENIEENYVNKSPSKDIPFRITLPIVNSKDDDSFSTDSFKFSEVKEQKKVNGSKRSPKSLDKCSVNSRYSECKTDYSGKVLQFNNCREKTLDLNSKREFPPLS